MENGHRVFRLFYRDIRIVTMPLKKQFEVRRDVGCSIPFSLRTVKCNARGVSKMGNDCFKHKRDERLIEDIVKEFDNTDFNEFEIDIDVPEMLTNTVMGSGTPSLMRVTLGSSPFISETQRSGKSVP